MNIMASLQGNQMSNHRIALSLLFHRTNSAPRHILLKTNIKPVDAFNPLCVILSPL